MSTNKRVLITWKKLYKKGYSIDRIAQLYKVNPERIERNLIKIVQEHSRLRKNGVTPDEVKEWVKSYSQISIYEIAKKYDRSVYTIRKYLISENVYIPKQVSEKLAKKWVYLYLIKDLTTLQIGRKYGFDRETVRRYLTKYDVKLHRNIEIREIINYKRFKNVYEKYKFNRKEKVNGS